MSGSNHSVEVEEGLQCANHLLVEMWKIHKSSCNKSVEVGEGHGNWTQEFKDSNHMVCYPQVPLSGLMDLNF
ncbi:hypothetical protein LOK49_LG03G00938 [Camellia lanceoleosa]|uniref:Uncharacterized protein n=1 Tax=Camellia lanceoleosa TaxID=1840588 RepID=A0ACC0IHN8_9ERIC|nr:hypothetical protein LOK49_LG03G00938 [Camellia lanceoleosa]